MPDTEVPSLIFLHAYGARKKGDIVCEAAAIAKIRREVPASFYVLTSIVVGADSNQAGEAKQG